MTESELARRAQIKMGDIIVDGFMLADGSYRMSQTQAAETVKLGRQSLSDFLRSKAIKRLLGEDYACQIFAEISIDPSDRKSGQSSFRAVPLEVVIAYWQWQSHRGNKTALSLCMALATETLERRFDEAFGVQRSTDDYNTRLSDRNQELERVVEQIGEAFAIDDDIKRERDYFLELLRQNGIEPYQLPDSESTEY